jgi:hypothetical protein
MKLERVVDGMTGFMPQNPQAFGFAGPFDFQHLRPFEFHKAGVGKIERYRKPAYAVGRKPFFRKPDMRFEPQRSCFQLPMQLLNPFF